MPGFDLASRLEILKENFGLRLQFDDPSDEGELEASAINSEDEMTAESSGRQEQAASQTGHCAVEPESPQGTGQTPSHDAAGDDAAGVPLDCSQFCVREHSDEDMAFCSWKVVRTYPDHFIGKANKPRAQPYFDRILEGRVWDFFYLYNLEKPLDEPQLLVPSLQFESFLRGINRELGTSLAIPGGVNQDRFYMRFGQGGTPRPRYLQRSRDKKKLEIGAWPDISKSDIEAFKAATPMEQEDWNAKWNMVAPRGPHRDKKKSAEQRATQRLLNRKRELHEAQEYLHLKGDIKQDVVLVCMDVEAIEVSPHPISEVGIAILDTRDIHDVPSGPCGQNWWQFIKSHHLRTKEYSGLVNHRHVKGCPDDFDFGSSAFPAKAELAKAIQLTLTPYTDEDRELVFVGHDANQDVKYLSSIGFEVYQLKHLLGQLDSKEIHQGWRSLDSGRSLANVLSDLFLTSTHLHNAGNDAVYTLHALVGVALEQIREEEAEARGEEYRPALWAK